jgi:hypothetical protein
MMRTFSGVLSGRDDLRARVQPQCGWLISGAPSEQMILECADVSALWNGATCRAVGKLRHVAALQIGSEEGLPETGWQNKVASVKRDTINFLA